MATTTSSPLAGTTGTTGTMGTTGTTGTTGPLSKEEQVRIQFFMTYDVMTGVRIAATLGGFFGLMVLLVVYKSHCRRTAIKEVRLAAAQAVVEEEDQQEAVAAAIYMQSVVTGRVVPPPDSAAADRPLPPLRPPRPLPLRFSSLGGCSLLEAKVAICAVRRASMLPNPPQRHLHTRLHLHQLQRHAQHQRESMQLQVQRLQLLQPQPQPRLRKTKRAASLCIGAAGAEAAGARPGAAPAPRLNRRRSVAIGAAGGGAPLDGPRSPRSRPPGTFRKQSSLGVIESALELPELVPASVPVPGCSVLTHQNSTGSEACFESFEMFCGEVTRTAPLARISTTSLRDVPEDSGSDSVFGIPADTAVDTGVDTGADTDQDADCQLSTDSDSSTPRQTGSTGRKHRLYVLPVGAAPGLTESGDTLHAAPHRPRPRLARTTKVVVASLDSAASDDCMTATPELEAVHSVQVQAEQASAQSELFTGT